MNWPPRDHRGGQSMVTDPSGRASPCLEAADVLSRPGRAVGTSVSLDSPPAAETSVLADSRLAAESAFVDSPPAVADSAWLDSLAAGDPIAPAAAVATLAALAATS